MFIDISDFLKTKLMKIVMILMKKKNQNDVNKEKIY